MVQVTLPDGRVIEVPDTAAPVGPVAGRRPPPGAGFVPPTGLIGSEQALAGGLRNALQTIGRGTGIARTDLAETQRLVGRTIGRGISEAGAAIGGGVARLDPFAAGGGAAFDRQTALSGALGPEAQQRAFDEFIASPGQAFLREEGERALLRGEAAIGGLGGGRVREELQRRGIGFAAQDFGNQFGRLNVLSQLGLTAAGQQAGLFGEGARIAAGLRGEEAGITTRLGEGRAGLVERAAGTGAAAILGTGRDVAAGRTRVGEGIAGAVSRTGSSLADLVSRGGAGVADILSRGTGNLANILSAAGQAAGASREELATLLANIATGSAAQRTALPALPGFQRGPGILSQIGQIASGVGTAAAAASDIRLKKNVLKIGETDNGINLYVWDWNAIGRKITGQLSGIGVIAQEILGVNPSAVINIDGYLHVDYGKI